MDELLAIFAQALVLGERGVQAVSEVVAIARRVQAGERVTDEEIAAAKAAIQSATERWDAAQDKDRV